MTNFQCGGSGWRLHYCFTVAMILLIIRRPRGPPDPDRATPFPWTGIVRIADALGNRAGMNVAVIDVPAFLSVLYGSAAGEFGHAALKRET
jgi:hypothetical protein